MTDDDLHGSARLAAAGLSDPDKRQLRFNEIVAAARDFYPSDPEVGVVELVQACDRAAPEIYVKGDPMWQTLRRDYAWMMPLESMN